MLSKTGERVIFEARSSKKIRKKYLLRNLIKLYRGEKIVEAQRQHKIVLILPIFAASTIGIVASVGMIVLLYQQFLEIPFLIIVNLFLTLISFLLVYATYTFMYWYYQFYIITTRCIMHKHFFRIAGYDVEEIFLETSPEREITRYSSNPIYGLFDIEDIYVYFQRPGIEIFTFKTPENAQKIEDCLKEVSLGNG